MTSAKSTEVELTQPGSGKLIRVAGDHADFWRGLGYRDKPKRAARKKAEPKVDEAKD